MAYNVQKAICNKIGNANFCIIVDESRKEQMTLVIRFVDRDDFIRECFLDLIHVHDAYFVTLKQAL
jgi:hypothetical protein